VSRERSWRVASRLCPCRWAPGSARGPFMCECVCPASRSQRRQNE
jgi:hypothetical protein